MGLSFGLGAAALLSGCGSSQIPLDRAEEQWTERTGRALGAQVWLQHDRQTFLAGRGRATLRLSIEGPSCQQDTVRLQQLARRLASEAHAVVRYNCIYDSILVTFSTWQATGPHSGQTLCARQVQVALTPAVHARMSRTWQY